LWKKSVDNEDRIDNSTPSATSPYESVQRALTLLEKAIAELSREAHSARYALGEAASLLREQIGSKPETDGADGRGLLLTWQARKVRDYIEAHIAGPLRVADLCALIQRSEGHFSRSFKRTFGMAPHAFLIRCRLERAAQYMLDTDASLSDIALRCGFTDHAHLCKHFRQATGQAPAAWRRVRRATGTRQPPREPRLEREYGWQV
jgi:AraC-like DNA-binding protein